MNENVRDFFNKMQSFFPSTKEEYQASIMEYGEVLETVVIEDIFMPPILMLLCKNDNKELLKDVFNYLEEVISKNDSYLNNIISITVLESLGNDKAILGIAKQYMGPKTVLLQIEADRALGR